MQLINKTKDGEVDNYELVSPFWNKRKGNERSDWIDQCAKLTKRSYRQMAWLFKGYELNFIKDLYLKSQETTSDKTKYFWYLWRLSKAK